MARLIIDFEGVEYTIEYNKRSVIALEQQGFDLSTLRTAPMSQSSVLFAAGFRMHHKGIKPDLVDRIFENLPDKEGLFAELINLYNAPYAAFMDDSAGNATWRKE